jgi:hypothetical protein
MPKKCKPTREAVLNRLEAVRRHGRIFGYEVNLPLNETAFGLKNKIPKFYGALTIEDLIESLKANE